MIYEQTDRMKVLKSQLMFSDIVAHRDRQVEEKVLGRNGKGDGSNVAPRNYASVQGV